MGHKWIIDVLADLKSFAQLNDLPLLAAQLDQTALVASAEIASLSSGTQGIGRGECAETESIFQSLEGGRRI